MCDRDCFNCGKPDCNFNGVTHDERISQDVRDRFALYERKYGAERVRADYNRSDRGRERNKRYDASEKGKERQKKYWQTEKGKEARRRYNSSEKGKARHREYMKSEKGKAIRKKQQQKLIASGKNAEYCRAYYQRKKEKQFRELTEGVE